MMFFLNDAVSKAFLSQSDFDIETINQTMREPIDRAKLERRSTNFYNLNEGKSAWHDIEFISMTF